jgi:hypothetical protein
MHKHVKYKESDKFIEIKHRAHNKHGRKIEPEITSTNESPQMTTGRKWEHLAC